mmetsp:Transcript_43017/g.30996  ORF Transcript_43017/g.30996 Transcript_43017/m.30996 type:complete len:171 (+) Transcript_43017:691-1203(+)
MLEKLGVYSLFEPGWVQNRVMWIVCGFFPSICDLGIEALATTNIEADDEDRMQVYMGHFPAGESTQTLLHYGQTYKHDKFQEFDYTRLGNELHYGTPEPPVIDLTLIEDKVPIAMFVGLDDELATPEDARWTRDQIGDAVVHYQEQIGGHISFTIGKDMTYFSETAMDII